MSVPMSTAGKIKLVRCRVCETPVPFKEVVTRFMLWGKERVRFRMCSDCRKQRRKDARKKEVV